MITDRTIADVELAKSLRLKIQAKQMLTDAEKAQFERGACTITMINRINTKITELEGRLNDLAYRVKQTENTTELAYNGILTASAYPCIFSNLESLKEAFFIYQSTPKTPSYLYGYLEANSIEKILVDIESMIIDMESHFRQCGTFTCGEGNEK